MSARDPAPTRSVVTDGFLLAVGTLTAVRVPAPSAVDRRRAGMAMTVAPLAVLPLAVLAGVIVLLGDLVGLPAPVTAGMVTGALALGTRCLHLDGLADTADGLTASYDRARSLEIMARGNTGPAGAAAVTLTLLLQTAAGAALLSRPWAPLLIGTLVALSRAGLLIACTPWVTTARPGGLGAMVAGTVRPVVAVAVGLAWCAAAGAVGHLAGLPWWQGSVAVIVAALVVTVLVRRCRSRLGGITGDVLGASVELGLLALLVTCTTG